MAFLFTTSKKKHDFFVLLHAQQFEVKLLFTSVILILEMMRQVHSAGESNNIIYFFLFMKKNVHCHEKERDRGTVWLLSSILPMFS